METMREILKKLMKKAGHTPYDIERISGLPAATTYRFLSGKITQPNDETLKAWARVYGVTEGQLRGFSPISGVEANPEKAELKDLLPLEEYNHVRLIRSLPDDSRNVLYKMAAMLAEPRAVYCADRRGEDVTPNPQRRVGEVRYKAPPVQRRIKSNDRFDSRKTSQSA